MNLDGCSGLQRIAPLRGCEKLEEVHALGLSSCRDLELSGSLRSVKTLHIELLLGPDWKGSPPHNTSPLVHLNLSHPGGTRWEDWALRRRLKSLRIHAGVMLTRLSNLTSLISITGLRLIDNQELQETPDRGELQTISTLHIVGSPRWSGEKEVGRLTQLRSLNLMGSGISDLLHLRD